MTWNRALVTGASSGIGLEIARQLAQAGTNLVVVARDTERLTQLAEELSSVDVEVLPADLGLPLELRSIEARLRSETNPVDLLVNNAGFGFSGQFVDMDLEKETAVVAVNITAVHRLCHAAGSTMKQRGQGGILNISSLASALPTPQNATYGATKHFVTAFSESLHEELKPFGVTVTASLPGLTRTEFQDRAGVDMSDSPKFLWQSAADCAAESLAALNAGKVKVVTGRVSKVGAGLIHVVPKALIRKASGRPENPMAPK